ncbi:MAG: ABC transporter permease [Coprobacillaceae bacterium]
MLKTLSMRNASRQAKDYLIYFITMIIAVALIYAFNGLVFSDKIKDLGSMMSSLPAVIVAASLVMIFIIGWLVSYTINFMLHKRSKELGTYMLLGIEQKQVAKMFFMENIIIGSIAIVVGIIVGNIMYQLLYAIVMNTFGVAFSLDFSISLGTIGLTLLYFIGVYIFALIRSRKRISKMKIYDLLHYDKKNEAKLVDTKKNRTLLFMTSTIAGIIGISLIAFTSSGLTFGIGSILVIVFLYGFFISISSFASHYLDTHPKQKYQGNKTFVLRTLLSKISSMSVTLATLSLLFSVAIGGIGSGMLFSTLFDERIERTTAYDIMITSDEESNLTKYADYIDDSTMDIEESYIYTVYQNDTRDYIKAMEDRGEDLAAFDKDSMMKISDYNTLRKMLDLPEVKLEKGKYIIHTIPAFTESMSDYIEENPQFTLKSYSLTMQEMYTENFSQYSWFGNGNGVLLVVPDNMVEDQPTEHSVYAAMTNTPITEEEWEEVTNISYDVNEDGLFDYPLSKEIERITYTSSYLIFVFPLYCIALIVMMVAATILSIQHLSEMSKNKYRYNILSKLGLDNKSLVKVMRKQLGIYFVLPALPGVVIGGVMIYAFSQVFDAGVASQVWPMLGISTLLFFVVYAIYIVATYTSFKRSIID